MIDLPSILEAVAAAVAGRIARTWRRLDAPELDEEDEELDDE